MKQLVGIVLGALVVSVAQARDFEVDLGRGGVPVAVPASYDPLEPLPLIVNLHGYMGSGDLVEGMMRLGRLVDERRFVYATPDGLRDWWGLRYWSATDYCCGLGAESDDSGYLEALVDEITARVSVDPKRIYFVGYSNGGFMSYRMACDHSERVAAIASLAGATFDDPGDCDATEPVHVLQIHGTEDDVIRFRGDCEGRCYPGAVETVRQWATLAECERAVERGPDLDLDREVAGAEAMTHRVERCSDGGSAALWTLRGSDHDPVLTDAFAERLVDHLYAHPKP